MAKKKQTRLHHSVKHRLHLAIVPHKKNKYQPYLVRLPGLMVVIVGIIALNFTAWGLYRPSVLGETNDVTMQQLISTTNAERIKMGTEPLQYNEKLAQAAALKAQNMYDEQYWAHTSPSGIEPWAWFKKAEYNYRYAGENLGRGFHTAGGVVAAWMESREHRHNLLNPEYKDVGFAVVSGNLLGENTSVVVALYGTPKSENTMLAPTSTRVLASTSEPIGLVTRLGVAAQSLTPVALGSVMILGLIAMISLLAHAYRKKLPKPVLSSWRRHHGLYKAVGMTSLIVMVLVLYGGGQI